jgi:hypothetical protein
MKPFISETSDVPREFWGKKETTIVFFGSPAFIQTGGLI